MPSVSTDDRSRELLEAIEIAGYYPAVVSAGIQTAVAGEEVLSFLLHHEPTIDRDEVRRHMTVLVLTPTRLILTHTDEHPSDEFLNHPYTSTSTEAISLSSVKSVVVNRLVVNPASIRNSGLVMAPAEALLTIGWGAAAHLELEPAGCADPDCDADHGYTGAITSDDFSLRASTAADGQRQVDALLAFSEALSARTQA